MSDEVSFDLSGKVMIVTGAGKGIGKSIAEAAARYGATLALGSRTVSESEETAPLVPTSVIMPMGIDLISRSISAVWAACQASSVDASSWWATILSQRSWG